MKKDTTNFFNNFEQEDNDDYQEVPFGDIFFALFSAMSDAFSNKIFNIDWELEKVENFLVKLGYKIISRTNKDGDVVKFAVKPDNPQIPDDESGNLIRVFNSEIQDILLNYFLKIKEG
jgi:Mg2+ and Co2+ transporter CorA